ncbi:MAG: acyltransferase [Hyphomonadaceae bacterium]|nr:acyltransferase [Hyphomonadaceae bacterium]
MSKIQNIRLPETAQFGFIPGLDGLRALSVLIVIIAHMGFEHIVPGGFGVTVFFFISGFLITRLLLAESAKQDGIKLGKFYMRRAIRLYPALLFMVYLTICLYLIMGYGRPVFMEVAAAVGYFTNFFQVSERIGGTLPFMPWTHLWSLAVEEHFYLGFPLLVIFFRKNFRHLALALGAIVLMAAVWRAHILFNTNLPAADYNYMMTDARIDSLAWGCLLSVLLHVKRTAKSFSHMIGFIPTVVGFTGIIASFLIRDETFRYTLRFSLQGFSLFLLVLNLYYWRTLDFAFSILDWKPLAWIGSVSYALYLWHVPMLDLFVRGLGDNLSVRIAAVAISFAAAAFSFHMVEKPFIAMRRKFGSHVGGNKLAYPTAPLHPAIKRFQRINRTNSRSG